VQSWAVLSRLLIAIAATWLACGTAAAQAPGGCAEGEARPSRNPAQRPVQTALCDYDRAELNRRVMSLLDLRRADLSIDNVERLFGLPPIHTLSDDPIVAFYGAGFSATEAAGDWRMMLMFSASFRGHEEPDRPRFTGSMRPVLIDPRDRPSNYMTLEWLAPSNVEIPTCLRLDPLIEEAKRKGWQFSSELSSITGGMQWLVHLRRDGIDFRLTWAPPRQCVNRLDLIAE
jgi:hypothetical protein